GHEGHDLVDSGLGPVPSGWRVVRLADVVDVNALTAKNLSGFTTITYVDISSVERGWIRELKLLDATQAPGRARRLVRDGDVIWSTVRPNLRAYALVIQPSPNCLVSTGFAVLSAKHIPISFMYALSTQDQFVEYL